MAPGTAGSVALPLKATRAGFTAMPIGTPFSISAWYSPAKSTALQNVSDCGSAKENSEDWCFACGRGACAPAESAARSCAIVTGDQREAVLGREVPA